MRNRIVSAAFALVAITLGTHATRADIVGAVLPASRAIAVNTTATAFATIINAGTATATNCGLAMPTGAPAATFSFQTTNATTNAPTGTVNTRVSIPAGGAQSFVFSIRPTVTFAQTDLALRFTCDGFTAAPITGVNTFLLTSSASATPDVVALAATIANDGVVRTPGTVAAGAVSVATINVGAPGTVTASIDTGSQTLNARFSICQTNSSAQCLQTPATSVNATFAANQAGTFSVFFTALGTEIPLDPARYRSFVRFKVGATTVGATSVAVETQVTLGTNGGTLQIGPVAVTAPEDSIVSGTKITAAAAAIPGGLPAGYAPLSAYTVTLVNAAGAPDDGLDARLVVLQREIGVAGRMRAAIAGNLAPHAHMAELVLHGALQRAGNLAHRVFGGVGA